MEHTINMNDTDINISRFEDESDTIYNYRVNYIKNNIDTSQLKELIKNSKIIANIKFKNCRYEAKIYHSVKNFL